MITYQSYLGAHGKRLREATSFPGFLSYPFKEVAREATPTPWEIASFWTPPSPRNFRCPPLEGERCGYFLELHIAEISIHVNGTNKPLGHCIYMQLYIQSLFTVKTTSNCNRYSFFSLSLRFEAINRRDESIVPACLNCMLLQGSTQEIG